MAKVLERKNKARVVISRAAHRQKPRKKGIMSGLTSADVSSSITKAFRASSLSETSKLQYMRRLEILAELGAHADTWTAITKHEETIAALQKKYRDRPASLHMYSTAVMSSFKHVPGLKELAPLSLLAWMGVDEEAKKPLQHHALTAQPTARQALGWVSFEKIVEKRESLPVGSDARLLISMYTLIPSLRNDLSNLRIHTVQPPEGASGNYLFLPHRGAAHLTITEFKTSKKYHQITEELPPALVTEIRASLKRRPREHLFVSQRERLPYKTESAFSGWANGMLKRTFGKPLTLTIMRHSYISHLDFNNLTPLERIEIAKKMGHSIDAQMKYQFIFKG